MKAETSPDRIFLRDFRLQVVIGILPSERILPQPLDLNLEVGFDLTEAALSGELSKTIDYSEITKAITFILETGRFRLLESAALAIVKFLLSPAAMGLAAEFAKITLTKPQALDGVAIPQVSVSRHQSDVEYVTSLHDSATVYSIFSSQDVDVWLAQGLDHRESLSEFYNLRPTSELILRPNSKLLVRTRPD